MSYRNLNRLLDAFVQWAASRAIVPDDAAEAARWRTRIAIMLEGRQHYLHKPDPTLWRSDDVRELLIDFLAPRQVDGWQLAEHAVATMRHFLHFLVQSERLHPASTTVTTLLKELDRAALAFPAAMADRSRWWLAKRVITAMLADGVSLDASDEEVDAWAWRFSARDADGRRPVLGSLMDEHPSYATGQVLIHGGQVAIVASPSPVDKHLIWPDASECGCLTLAYPPAYPAIALPEPGVLATDVARYGGQLLGDLVTLASWVGPAGLPVDRRGELSKQDVMAAAALLNLRTTGSSRPSDLPALDRLWRLALELDLLQLRRTRVVAGDGLAVAEAGLHGDGPTERVLTLWTDLFDMLVDPPADHLLKEHRLVRDWVQPWLPLFLGQLYANCPDGEACDVEVAIARLLHDHAGRTPSKDAHMFESFAATWIRQGLAELSRHGAVRLHEGVHMLGPPDRVPALGATGFVAWAIFPTAGTKVGLTDLGRYVVRERLLAEGATAPLATQPRPVRAGQGQPRRRSGRARRAPHRARSRRQRA